MAAEKMHEENLESDDSGDDTEEEMNSMIQKLILEAEVNPYQYDKHIKLISALRTLGDLDQLRSAREKMATVYPLSEDLWLEWFSDELPLAVLQEQKQFLQQKFEQAVKDYSSVKIWHEYCQFVMNNIESPTDIEKARSIFERAITAVGLNVIEGASVWEGFREFEIAILDSYQQLQDSGDAIGMCAKVEAQIERIASLFKRQLSIPLLGMEDVMSAYEDWSSEGVPAEVHRSYQRASDKLQLCMQHESKLTSSEGDASLTAYLDYVSYEMKDGDPARIQCLFERAIKQHCLHYDLWIKYLNYLDYKLKITDIALPVHERAVRNCPWIATLWIRYLHSLERGKKDYSKIKDVFNESLKGGFSGSGAYLQLWISHCDYHRRRIDDWTTEMEKVEDLHKCYEEAVTYMQQYFGLEGDEECVILRDLAFIEAKHLNNLEKGKDLWKTILKKHQRSTNMWLEYITYLKLFGDVTSVRRAFQRAIQISFDQPELILQEFIRYERLYGDLSDLDDAQQKVDSQMIKINEKRIKEASEKANKTEQKEKPRKDKRNKKNIENEERTNKQNKKKQKANKLKRTTLPNAMDVDSPVKKRKEVEDTVETEDCNNITPSSIEALNTKGESTSNQSTTLEHNFLPPANVAMATKQPGGTTANVEKEENADEELKSDQVIVDGEAVRKVDNELSIFLSNLLFTVDEKHIKDKFQQCGEIDTIRIVKNRAGKSKGYAYLQFKSMKGVEESLLLDRQPMLGRPMFVSRCVDKRQNPTKFKFPTELDKHTLYVSNLPFEMSNDQLETYFAAVGKLKQVRLVTNRSGKSKGYAYVEYETEADAKTAIVKFDQKPLHDRPINVALSNPPSRKNANAHEGIARALKPKEQPGVRSKARTQISMVPRALQKPATNTTKNEPIAEKMDTTTTEAENSAAPKAMSNEEFRKFLMS